ncbi:hypothetical protein [Streptomyces sp. NPDC088348]|uniref:hypothetical protein n=1 Tax=Streptomyces sp. NPDC088348 TaxID=3365853 RepID=UPI00382A8693
MLRRRQGELLEVTGTERMPSFSATDRAPAAAGVTPVAGGTSHASATGVTAPNRETINSGARRGRDEGRGARAVSARAHRPTGTSGTPTPANRSAH